MFGNRYFFVLNFVLIGFCFSQNSEPELDSFLLSNPDILEQVMGQEKSDLPDQAHQVNPIESVELTKIEQDRAKLAAAKFCINTIFQDYLNQLSFVNQNVQTELSKLKLILDSDISSIDKRIDNLIKEGADCAYDCEWRVNCLHDLIFNFKVACLKLELLSIKYNSDEYCFLNPLDYVELEYAKFIVFKELLNLYFRAHPKLVLYNQYIIKKIVLCALPARFKKSFLDYILFGFTQKTVTAYWVNTVLNSNFYEKYPVLGEGYLDVISGFYKVKNYQEQIDVVHFINKTEKVIDDFINKNAQIGLSCLDKCFLSIYLSNLIKIKNYFIKFYKPESASESAKEKSKLLIRFKLLLEDDKIEFLGTDSSFCCFFNLYCNVLHKFFDNDSNLNKIDLQLFELIFKLEKLKNDRQAPLLKYYLSKPNDAYVVYEDMLKLLKDISIFVNKELNKSEKGFLAKLFSGQWIDSRKLKGMGVGGMESVLGFMEQIFDRKFDNFQEAAFFLLARVSPVLAAGLIYKIIPHLSDDLQKKASGLLDVVSQDSGIEEDLVSNKNADRGENKILEFISQNPEIFKKLCEVRPELINGLADVVQSKLAE